MLLFLIVRQYFLAKLEKQKITAVKQQAIEKERTRIATDMHDDLGAGLSRIRFLGETIDWKSKSGQSIGEDIKKIKTYSHEMIDKMGEIVWALNQKNDSLEDLLTYIRAYAVDYLEHNGIAHQVDMVNTIPILFVSGEMRRNIFLTIKEALHNVVKHAKATNVYLGVQISVELQITIRDDGIGFDPSQVRPYSNGLSNMRKRIAEINGHLEIRHEKGTSIQISIPLDK
jgi:signal transduction histidine kinase